VRDGRWKLIRFYEDESLELYDLDADISERNDLAGRHPDTVARLAEQLERWLVATDALLPAANPRHPAAQF
jgi:hypothetical protein